MGNNSGLVALLGLGVLYALSKKNGGLTLIDRTSSVNWTVLSGIVEQQSEAEEIPIIQGPRHRIKPVDPASRARAYAEAYPGGPMFGFDEPAVVIPVKRIRHRIKPVIPAERAVAYEKAYGPLVGFDE